MAALTFVVVSALIAAINAFHISDQPKNSRVSLGQPSRTASLILSLGYNATDGERYAASRLQGYLRHMLRNNNSVPLVNPATARGKPQIAVGSEATLALVPFALDQLASLGEEGFVILTSNDTRSIAVSGAIGARRGTLYAVHRLLEVAGFDFLSYDVTNTPSPTSALWSGPVLIRQVPALEWRHSNNANIELQQHVNFSIALGNNNGGGTEDYTGQDIHKPGGGLRWASPPGFVHTSLILVPPDIYNQTHPEWFADTPPAPGRPTHGHQLCWGNISLLRFVAKRAVKFLTDQPTATAISISQNDGTGTDGHTDPCKRDADMAIYRQEGSWSGPLLRGVNYIADVIAAAFPRRDIIVSTLAYRY